jgi:hypothetical protein
VEDSLDPFCIILKRQGNHSSDRAQRTDASLANGGANKVRPRLSGQGGLSCSWARSRLFRGPIDGAAAAPGYDASLVLYFNITTCDKFDGAARGIHRNFHYHTLPIYGIFRSDATHRPTPCCPAGQRRNKPFAKVSKNVTTHCQEKPSLASG